MTGLLLSAALAAAPVPAVGAAGVAILCDPAGPRFSVRAGARAGGLDRSYPQRRLVSVDALFDANLPNRSGDPEIRAPLTRYERCGPYTFRLRGDAYNGNIGGEAGAYDPFASVALIRGNETVELGGTTELRLTECDRNLPRAVPCPDGYAVRLDGAYDAARGALRLVVTTSSTEYDDPATTRMDVRRQDYADDLGPWRANTAGARKNR